MSIYDSQRWLFCCVLLLGIYYCIIISYSFVVCSLCWFSCQYLPNDWLERHPLRMPICGKEIISPKIRSKSTFMSFLFFSFVYCLLMSVCPRPCTIYFMCLRRICAKMSLNTNQTTHSHVYIILITLHNVSSLDFEQHLIQL